MTIREPAARRGFTLWQQAARHMVFMGLAQPHSWRHARGRLTERTGRRRSRLCRRGGRHLWEQVLPQELTDRLGTPSRRHGVLTVGCRVGSQLFARRAVRDRFWGFGLCMRGRQMQPEESLSALRLYSAQCGSGTFQAAPADREANRREASRVAAWG